MNNNAGANSNATITPNTLSAITTVLNSSSAQYSSVTHAPATSSHLSTSITANQENSDPPYLSASSAASTAANGLYLLSQAHQELTKREEAQARANNVANATNGRRGTKRKSYDAASPPPQPVPTTRDQHTAPVKRARANTVTSVSTNGRGKASTDDEEDDEDEDDDDMPSQNPGGRKQTKKPETEEEKRRNFLERNRQGLSLCLDFFFTSLSYRPAALKCRQRKKAWLASLQAKVEYLQTENERLSSALVSSREEISRLSALVGGAVIGPGCPTVGPGVGPPSVAVNGVATNGQPISMNMNLVAKGAPAATSGRASYGY
jgi:ATF/CREB family transcription factor